MKENNRMKRMLAVLTLAVLAVCLMLTLIFAFTGSKYFMVMLMLTLLMPILLWICMFFYKQSKDRSKDS
ncbi:MAG: hypothetical protein E7253_05485 [Lachnospiraceae bacterium]|nr:hypothetical protein [Lachnospiraceae bacterium]